MTDPALGALFASHRELRAVVDAVLEGRQGRVRRDGGAARLSLGCYEVFGGDPASPGARRLVAEAAAPCELAYGNDAEWRRLILDVHGGAVFDRPMRDFDASLLDRGTLRRIEEALPARFSLTRLDAELAGQLDNGLVPHALQVFRGPDDFVAHGLGFGAVLDGRLACAATSYTMSSRRSEVAIATRPEFRGRGLAAAAAAAFMGHCLDHGLVPCWSASNPVSQRLAVRLGYRSAGWCEILFLRGSGG
jgi:GNAT superfamily N-acetyltransferase